MIRKVIVYSKSALTEITDRFRSEELFFGISRELDEYRVAVRDDAFGIGFGDNEIILSHHALNGVWLDLSLHPALLRWKIFGVPVRSTNLLH